MAKALALLLLIAVNCCSSIKYYNYTLYRGIPVNEQHLNFFNNLTKMFDVNFWRPPGLLHRPIEFTIGPGDKKLFLEMADEIGIYLTTILPDVQKAFDMQTVKTYIRRKMDSFDWRNYFRLADIYSWLSDLQKAYPQETQLASIGRTHENRDIMALRIVLKGCSKIRSTVIVEGGIHAREWISPAFVTYFIHEILTSALSNDPALKHIANLYEWFFVPILNPDGYEYTHNTDRLWRKNRRGQFGVDLNRNFARQFCKVGSTWDKSSEVYCGQSPFSEPESSAMAKLVQANSKRLEYYLSFHSYGQFMIIPYADSKEHIDNFHEVRTMGLQAADRIAANYKTHYSVGTAYDTVDSKVPSCPLQSLEYKNGVLRYVITLELRDDGYYGFALPPSLILPTCIETMSGMISFLTPRKESYSKIEQQFSSSTGDTFLDKLVIFCNVVLFVIVRFG